MNGLVMYDHQTDSLWSQVIGQGVDGLFNGVKLTVIPALQTTWERWVSDNPTTLVLDKGGGYKYDSYRSYYNRSDLGILGETRIDDRVAQKEVVMGVTVAGRAKAYPFNMLAETPVVNDVFNGVPLLVTFDIASRTSVVFNPTVGGSRLKFQEVQASGEFLIEDFKTGSVWNPVTGIAREGPLAGTKLEQVASHYEFWFAWKDYRPQTELYHGQGP